MKKFLFAVRGKGPFLPLVYHLACGALLGAFVLGTLKTAPFFMVGSLGFGALALRGSTHLGWGRFVSSGAVVAVMALTAGLIWPRTLGRYRPVSEEEYLSLELQVHTLLAEVSPHDVWSVVLPRGNAQGTLQDLDEAMASHGGMTGDDRVALAAVMGAYAVAARALGLHDDDCARPETSVKRRFQEGAGEGAPTSGDQGPFVYRSEREALLEIRSCLGHAVYAYALIPTDEGLTLYWAAYALRVGWFTPYYMALIDPLRRLIVFPSLLEKMEGAWRSTWTPKQRASQH
jgi:hypothetical protein